MPSLLEAERAKGFGSISNTATKCRPLRAAVAALILSALWLWRACR